MIIIIIILQFRIYFCDCKLFFVLLHQPLPWIRPCAYEVVQYLTSCADQSTRFHYLTTTSEILLK